MFKFGVKMIFKISLKIMLVSKNNVVSQSVKALQVLKH